MNESTMNSEVERRLIGAYEAAKAAVAHGADLSMVQVPTVDTLRRSARQPIRWLSPVVAGAGVVMVGGTVATVGGGELEGGPAWCRSRRCTTRPAPGTPIAVQKVIEAASVADVVVSPGEPWKQKTDNLGSGAAFSLCGLHALWFQPDRVGGRRWSRWPRRLQFHSLGGWGSDGNGCRTMTLIDPGTPDSL